MKVLAVLGALAAISNVSAHNHLIWPTPRDPRQTYAGDNSCESGNGNIPGGQNFQRGQTINPRWSYNNHRGGFVRFAIVRRGQENQNGVFNRRENIIAFACHNQNCAGAGVGFDSGDKIPCSTRVTIPTHLPDGDYVLQWVVYSMFDSDANPNKGLPNYLSCANIRIQGGAALSGKANQCGFTWAGGDKEYTRTRRNAPKDTCVYFIKNTMGRAWDTVKIDPNMIKVGGVPAEVQDCLGRGGVNQKGDGTTNAPATNNNNNNNNNDNDDDVVEGQCNEHYRSVGGDNCDSIARAHGITTSRFQKMNSFINCDDIWVGTNCCVDKPPRGNNNNNNKPQNNQPEVDDNAECKEEYRSSPGDNCENIAQKFGITADRFHRWNSFINCDDIWAGTPCCVRK